MRVRYVDKGAPRPGFDLEVFRMAGQLDVATFGLGFRVDDRNAPVAVSNEHVPGRLIDPDVIRVVAEPDGFHGLQTVAAVKPDGTVACARHDN